MSAAEERYRQLLSEAGGDPGEAYNRASGARGLSTDPEAVALERYAQGAENPINGLVAGPYEGMKWIEQNTPVPALSSAIDLFSLPQGWKPGKGTSPASLSNVFNAVHGALDRIRGGLPVAEKKKEAKPEVKTAKVDQVMKVYTKQTPKLTNLR